MTGLLDRRHLIHSMLRAGFGVEDITIKVRKMGLHISDTIVRHEVSRLRESGELMNVLALEWRSHGKTPDSDKEVQSNFSEETT